MAKYLYVGSYTTDGVKGLMKDGGTGREKAVRELIESVGGTMDAIYFSFGEDDVFVIADFPDNASGAAVALTVGASGAFQGRTVVLMEPSEVDDAVKKSPRYRAPGA